MSADLPDYAARGLNPERLRAVEQHAGPEILDVGCGSGAYVLHFADRRRIRGVDFRPFESWQQRPDLFAISDAARLQVPDASCDTILSFETLEHLADPAGALREYFRVCRRNLILTVPNCVVTDGMRRSGVIFNHWIDRTHVNFWDIDSITALVERSGFRVTRREHINRIDLRYLVDESLDRRSLLARLVRSLYKRLPRRPYYMTCLVVGEKPQAG